MQQTGPHTFVFADLVGFTSLTSVVGDEAAADLALRFFGDAAQLASRHDAEAVKLIGDAVMLRGSSPAGAVRMALELLSEPDGLPPIRIGMDTGPATRRAGDW